MWRGAGEGAVLLVPLLVIVLGDPEGARRGDLGGDPVGQPLLLLVARRHGGGLLLRAEREDRGSILSAAIRPLPVAARRIVRPPEEAEQLRVADLLRIELDQERLGVAGPMAGDVLVRRVLRLSAGVADRGGDDAGHLPEPLLDPPEAALGEDRELVLAGGGERRPAPDVAGVLADARIADHRGSSTRRSRRWRGPHGRD